jgi:hypothetical protein
MTSASPRPSTCLKHPKPLPPPTICLTISKLCYNATNLNQGASLNE